MPGFWENKKGSIRRALFKNVIKLFRQNSLFGNNSPAVYVLFPAPVFSVRIIEFDLKSLFNPPVLVYDSTDLRSYATAYDHVPGFQLFSVVFVNCIIIYNHRVFLQTSGK